MYLMPRVPKICIYEELTSPRLCIVRSPMERGKTGLPRGSSGIGGTVFLLLTCVLVFLGLDFSSEIKKEKNIAIIEKAGAHIQV